jgi:phage-related protein
MREIVFYRSANHRSPVEDFLDSLTAKQARKVTWVLQLVETLERVPIQYFKKLEGTDGIWEVRADLGRDTFRLLGFFDKGNLVILTNGFAKKSQNTPVSEIKLAEQRKTDYLTRDIKK